MQPAAGHLWECMHHAGRPVFVAVAVCPGMPALCWPSTFQWYMAPRLPVFQPPALSHCEGSSCSTGVLWKVLYTQRLPILWVLCWLFDSAPVLTAHASLSHAFIPASTTGAERCSGSLRRCWLPLTGGEAVRGH